MNSILNKSASRHDFKPNDEVYIPFWVVLQFLDVTPPDPFIKCRILTLGTSTFQSPAGEIEYAACDLELGKPGLIADGIPIEYLIQPDHLKHWAHEIAEWFRKYPDTCNNISHQPTPSIA